MAKREKKETFRTSIGGQALIEGILMRGPEKQAIVVRAPEGLVTKVEELKLVRDRYPILGLPIIRGVVTFLDSMVKGIKALMFSADYFPDDESAQPSKLDTWLEKHVPAEKLQSVLVGVSLVLSLGLTLLLFMLLPTFVACPKRLGPQPHRGHHQDRHIPGLPDPLLQAKGCAPGVSVSRCRA